MYINKYKYQKNIIKSLLKSSQILIIGNINHKNYRLNLKIEQILKTEIKNFFYRVKNIHFINELKLGIFFNISNSINGSTFCIPSNSLENFLKLKRVFTVFYIIINNRVYLPNNFLKIKNYSHQSNVLNLYLKLHILSKKLNITLIKSHK